MSNPLSLDDNVEPAVEKPAAPAPEGGDDMKEYIAKLEKRMADKDSFIETLKAETGGMRADLEKISRELQTEKAAREQLLSRRMEQAPKEPHPAPAVEAPNVQELIEKTLSERETKARADANLSEVNVALTKHYGDPAKAKEAVEAKAASLGMSSKDISSLAARSPAAAMELLGLKIETKPQVSIGTKSSVNLAAAPAETAATTKAQFDEMRRKNPGQYWSPAVQRKLKELVAEGKYFS